MGRTGFVGLCIGLGFLVSAWPCEAGIVQVGGVTIRSGADVDAYVTDGAGGAYICFPGTERWALGGSVEDYHAMPLSVVEEAIRAVEYPIRDLDIEVLILPVPRQHIPESSAEGRVVFLSPGKVPYPRQHIHYIVAHEIGHVVQHLLMPDSRTDLWRRYSALRGLDPNGGDDPLAHAWRPAEVFAEDFRVLFGGESARCGGNVENHEIARPEDVEGLRGFLLSLPGEWENLRRISAYPNPFISEVVLEVFSLAAAGYTVDIRILDIQGREVRDLQSPARGSVYLVWDGSDRGGEVVGPGVYFALVRAGPDMCIHKLIKR